MAKKQKAAPDLALCDALVANAGAVRCPSCGGAGFYDNRETKKTATAPDFRCKSRECDTGTGYAFGVWLPEDYDAPAPAAAAPAAAAVSGATAPAANPSSPYASHRPSGPSVRSRGEWPKSPRPLVKAAYVAAATVIADVLAALPETARASVANDGQALVTLIAGMVIRYHDMGGADYERDAWWRKVHAAAETETAKRQAVQREAAAMARNDFSAAVPEPEQDADDDDLPF